MQLRKFQFILLVVLCMPSGLLGNNIQLSNATVNGRNTTTKTANVQFNLSWENSWRTTSAPNNWDAAWVFVKFRVGESDPILTGANTALNGAYSTNKVNVSSTANLRVGMPVVVISGTGTFINDSYITSIISDTQFEVNQVPNPPLSNATIVCRRIWEHAALDTTDANHTAPAGSTINAPNDSTGVFIYRSSAGTGTNSWNNIGLRWNYGSNGVADNSYVEVKLFAFEMVHVPQGSFVVGSGGSGTLEFYTHTTNVPYQISSENAITVGTSSGNLYYPYRVNGGDQSGPIPAAFPKGYDAFYCMKYEISQGQYRDFLNTLTYKHQDKRTATASNSAAGTGALISTNVRRNGIDIQTPGNATTYVPAVYGCNLDGDTIYNESNDGEWIACNYLNWIDGCAYLDWAGLRPMTELEYEKACRGTQAAVANEYAWGTTTIAASNYTLSNAGAGNEGIATNYSTTNGNASYSTTDGSINGPLRGGIFVANGSNGGRTTSGASYYGIMELTGNLNDMTVSVGSTTGRAFTGLHGDGILHNSGNANTSFWPQTDPDVGVAGAKGTGGRGGWWNSSAPGDLRVSDRARADGEYNNRFDFNGIRGVRSAP